MRSNSFPFLPLLYALNLFSTSVSSQASRPGITLSNHGANLMTMTDANKNIGVDTADGLQYLVDINLGGQNFTVLLDTGSTDLWVDARGRDLQLSNATDVETTEAYGKGTASGKIAFAELKVGEYTIPSQVFLGATEILDMPAGTQGIMGMAFDNAAIFATLQMVWGPEAAEELGRSPITNLFAMNTSVPNNFDVQLGRPTVNESVNVGTFVIGGHASGYEDVTEAPKLPRVRPEHWSLVLDEMRINGEAFAFNKSSVAGVPQGKVVAALDTGFSLPPLPPAAVDAIYSGIPGSAFWTSPILSGWVIPCESSVELSFVFGGKEYMVHPLDLSILSPLPIIENGEEKNVTICVASYSYLTLDPSAGFTGFDLILGDAFLRSVYASFDYGDYNPMNHTTGLPFVQMVSTVDPHTAMDEFHEEREAFLAELPPTIEPSVFVKAQLAPSILPPSTTNTTSPDGTVISGALASDENDAQNGSVPRWLSKNWAVTVLGLLGANLLVGIVLLGVTVTICVRGVKGKARDVGARYTPVRFKDVVDHDPEGGVPKYND